ncbi:2734_t:CDS:1, partial [Gigaspora margarita]
MLLQYSDLGCIAFSIEQARHLVGVFYIFRTNFQSKLSPSE